MRTASAADERGRAIAWVLLVILVLNGAVVAIKAVVGWSTGSLSVLGDAVHSTMDGLNNVVGLIAVRLAYQPPDREHPYGHGKFETLTAFVIAGLLALTALGLMRSAAQRLLGHSVAAPEITAVAAGLMLATWVINWFVALYERGEGRRLGSELLLADAAHTLSDVLVTGSILVSFAFAEWPTYRLIDAGLSLAIAGVIGWTGYRIFAATLPVLTDRVAVAPEQIEHVARAVPGILGCHNVRSRRVGEAIFVEMHVDIEETDSLKAHALTEAIEDALRAAFGAACTATIHVEPVQRFAARRQNTDARE